MIQYLKELKELAKHNLSDEKVAALYAKIKLSELTSPDEIKKLGWCECILSNIFHPKEELLTLFGSWNDFRSNAPIGFFHRDILTNPAFTNLVYLDEVNKCYLMTSHDRPQEIILKPEDNKFAITASSSLRNVFSSPVARKVTVYHLFNSYFRNHEGAARKNYVKPKGEAFGIEIEMKFPTVFSKLRFSHYVGNNFPDWITERDGSLEDKGKAGLGGLELVSPPLSYNKLLTQLEPILKEARAQSGIGHEAGVFYGIHLNVNIYGENTDRTARRLVCIINDPQLRIFWETLSRRRGSAAMQEYCQFKDVLPETCLKTESVDHYRAAYCRLDGNGYFNNCVEVRIFRSNLKYASVKITVEIMKLTLDFCMGKNDIKDYAAYRDYIYSNASSELKEFIYASKDCAFELDRVARITEEAKLNANLANFI